MSRSARAAVVSWCVLLMLGGCVRSVAVPPPSAKPTPPPPQKPSSLIGHEETGSASWYGQPHHGRKTASGEVYDMNELTAAHRTLPIGTRLQVTNLANGKSVEVRVNDRGPFTRGRILDLSHGAARALGAVGEGVIRVRLRVVSVPGESNGKPLAAVAGSFAGLVRMTAALD